jgi:uncharacterized membrane protein YvbJ
MARKKRVKQKAPDVCPVCGKEVPRGSLACPECGADHSSGWREDADAYDALDLPDEDFNYEDFIRKEFGQTPKPTGITMVWWITAIVVTVLFVAIYFYAAR